MLLVVALYVYDAACLLYANEAVLIPIGRGRWKAAFGSDQARLLGRELVLPDLMAPHRPVFRLSWRLDGDDENVVADASWSQLAVELRRPAVLIWGVAFALFVLLPLGLFSGLGLAMILAALAVLYLNIAAAVYWLYRRRGVLALERRRIAALALEALVCPPMALNLLRKVAASRVVVEPFPVAARRLLAAEDWDAARGACLARIEDEIAGEAEGTPRMAALEAQRERFREQTKP
jgi:hypothetical protein